MLAPNTGPHHRGNQCQQKEVAQEWQELRLERLIAALGINRSDCAGRQPISLTRDHLAFLNRLEDRRRFSRGLILTRQTLGAIGEDVGRDVGDHEGH